jgi:TonB-linked SusC/RagA family outer membrane protein
VVVIAYGTAKKRDLTGSVTSISNEQVAAQQVSTVSRALEGLTTGVLFSNLSGQPGADANIQIRGLGSISGATSPLIVVDGVATSFDLNSINPDDIESIVVSKDAAANALYGSRAAHGLLLVTTKQGKVGKVKVNVSARVGASSRGIPDYDKITDPAEYYEFVWKSIYQYNKYFPDRSAALQAMDDTQLRQYTSDNLFTASGNSIVARNGLYNTMLYKIPDNTNLVGTDGKLRSDAELLFHDDWEDYLLKTVLRQEYSANVSGATEKSDYYFSVGYLNNPSYVMGSDFNRYSARVKLNTQVTSWLKTGINLSYGRTYSNAPNYTGGTVNTNAFAWLGLFSPIAPLYAHDKDGSIILDADGKKTFDLGTGQTYSPYGATTRAAFTGYSPGIYFEKDLSETTYNNYNAYSYAEVAFLKDFKFRIDFNLDERHRLSKSYGNNESGTAARDNKGTISNTWSRGTAINTTQFLYWNKDFGAHHLDAQAGHEYRWWSAIDMTGNKGWMFMNDQPTMPNAIQILALTGNENSYALEGYLGRINYNYAGKYYINASLRRDGSSSFRNDTWGTFWSIGGAYRISDENFMKEATPWLSELKLRANYGTLGNNNANAWAWTDLWQISNAGNIMTPDLAIAQAAFGNANLTWETVHTWDIGFDFRILERFYGTIDYFQRNTTDMLWNVPLPASTGQGSATQNAGEMFNAGVEVDLGVDIIRTKDIKWSFGLNGSHYRNELKKIPKGVGSELYDGAYTEGNYLRGVGKDYYNLFMYKYAGVDQQTGLGMLYKELKEGDDLTKWAGSKVGDVVKTTVPAEATRFELGTATAKLIGGFNTNFRYKNIDFALIASYQLGGKVVSLSYLNLTGQTLGRGVSRDVLDAWSPENKSSNIPMRMYGGTNYGPQPFGGAAGQYSDFALFNASYLNMKSISIGYSLPRDIIRKAFIENLRIYVSGENLFLLSAKKGLDPRVSLQGGGEVGAFGFPQARVISFGLNITL